MATKLSLSALGLLFMSRPVLSCILAYPIGWWGSIDNQRFALFFIVPGLLMFHGLYIWESNGMLELWPPFLFVDIVLFSPALILHILGKRHRKSECSL